ncbi:MAG: twin-arginine translocase subunit TatC [Legionella sp.]
MTLYLQELRCRAMQVLAAFVVLFLFFFIYSNELLLYLVKPLSRLLPMHSAVITTQLTATVLVPLKLAMNAATICCAPILLFHGWRFVAPGLYLVERQQLRWVIVASFGLFLLGMIFSFYLMLPWMLSFFVHALPPGVQLMPDMSYAIDFITQFLLLLGFSFQIPLICVAVVLMRIVDLTSLILARPYVIVAAFILGMLLTPPDVMSQIMLAIPLWCLYELGVFFARAIKNKHHDICPTISGAYRRKPR